MSFIKKAVMRPVTIIMITLIIVFMGAIGFTQTSVDLMPELELPFAGVITVYPGASPQEVEDLVTKPIESDLGTVANLDSTMSMSMENMSFVGFMFDWGTDITDVIPDLESKLDLAQADLPEDVQSPMILKFDPTMMPTLQVGVESKTNQSPEEITRFVNDVIKPEIEQVGGVASVDLIGASDQIVSINLDPEALAKYELTQDSIMQVMQASNVVIPAGNIEKDNQIIGVRAQSKLDSIEDIKNLTVSFDQTSMPPRPVTLADVSEVEVTVDEVSSLYRLNGNSGIAFSVTKEASANTLDMVDGVKDRIDELEDENDGYNFSITADESKIVEQSVNNVTSSGLLGMLFAVVVLFLFLRNWRSTAIIAASIPVSVVATFALIYYADMTLNIMTLGGLVLGIGMLVDNSIVVLENIYRHMVAEKEKPFKAAIQGAKEVSGAVLASTLTTIVVFLPITFVGGIAAQFFNDFAMTVVFSLTASLVVALTIVPVLASLLLKEGTFKKEKEGWFKKAYLKILDWSLDHRAMTVIITIILLVGTFGLAYQTVETELMPEMEQGELSIQVNLSEGSNLDLTSDVVSDIEKKVLEYDDVEFVSSQIGGGEDMQSMMTGLTGESMATVNVKLKDSSDREMSTQEVLEEVRMDLGDLNTPDNTSVAVNKRQGQTMSAMGSEIEYEITGKDFEEVKKVTEAFVKELEKKEGLSNVSSNLETKTSYLTYDLDQLQLFATGLVPAQTGSAIRNANIPQEIGYVNYEGNTLPIKIGYPGDYLSSEDDISGMSVQSPVGMPATVGDVSSVEVQEVPTALTRSDQQPSTTVSALLDGISLSEAQSAAGEAKDAIDIPDGVEVLEAGAGEMQGDSFRSLGYAFVAAIVLVYMVMAAQFEKLLHPFIIMITVPLALIGVFLGVMISGTSFGMASFIGIIMLAGIVVNNGIVFVDYTEQQQEKGRSVRESLVLSGKNRLRPILMTALTTILSLIPIAIGLGEGSEMLQPMGIAVIGGLISTTFLTLVVVPVLYSLLEQLVGRNKRKKV